MTFIYMLVTLTTGYKYVIKYSKLLGTIIAALQYARLKQPDGSHKIVWLFDANIPYFESSHRIVLFVISLFIIVLGAIYTILFCYHK